MLSHGKKILFWDELPPDSIAPLLDALGVDLRDRQYGQPKDHVHRDIPRADREELATALAAGEILMGYMGWADCRICGVRLGTRDFFGHGFVWPEKAEHYVLVHHVWTPECYELLAALRRQKGQKKKTCVEPRSPSSIQPATSTRYATRSSSR